MTKLTEEQKNGIQKVVDELRSGKYIKIKNKLRDDNNGRCCLGVMCDVYNELGGFGRWDRMESKSDIFFISGDDFSCSMMPNNVSDYFGFTSVNPMVQVTFTDY